MLNKIRNTFWLLGGGCCVFLLLLNACTPRATPTLFIPPSPAAATSNPSAASEEAPLPTPTAILLRMETRTPAPRQTHTPTASPTLACQDNLTYLQDLTLPDGILVKPGDTLEKQWQVQNNGNCNWNGEYRLKLIEGYPALGAPTEAALYPAAAGSVATLTITFIAPTEPGVYRTAWQAYSPLNTPFGDTVYMEIIVEP